MNMWTKIQMVGHGLVIVAIWCWIWYYGQHSTYIVWWAWWVAGIVTAVNLLSILLLRAKR
jgi:hypothetical protein